MIISTEFPGDCNGDLKQAQHDLYGTDDGVSFLCWSAQERYARAICLLGVETELWQQMLRHDELYYPHLAKPQQHVPMQFFEHRVLQPSHDVVAAVFRFRHPNLWTPLFPATEAGLKELGALWVDFWAVQVERLVGIDRIAIAVLEAVAYQNKEKGYAAEHELLDLVQAEYPDLPWKQRST